MRLLGASARRCAAGISLTEAILATAVAAVAVTALVYTLGVGAESTHGGASMTRGVQLAQAVREMTLRLDWDGIVALDGQTFDPPLGAGAAALEGLEGWSQTVEVLYADYSGDDGLTLHDVTAGSDPDPTGLVRITVLVESNGKQAAELHWLAAQQM